MRFGNFLAFGMFAGRAIITASLLLGILSPNIVTAGRIQREEQGKFNNVVVTYTSHKTLFTDKR